MTTNRTKIVATLSDLKANETFVQELVDAGVNVFRLNTAHMELESAEIVIDTIRAVSSRVAILIDTKGPEIRTIGVEKPIKVKSGDTLTILPEGEKSEEPHFCVSYMGFSTRIQRGQEILLDDGELSFTALEIQKKKILCVANNSGEVKNKKGVNIPNIPMDLPSLTEKDEEFIHFAARKKIDFIAHSFVRDKEDVLSVQRILDKHRSHVQIISKIENRQGLDNLKEILNHCAGIMVARGDLGIELPAADVPIFQKKMIRKCIKRGKIAITATQMLHSMIHNPRPTRAEVSDVANAIMDGTDAIMLSGETAYGDYPVEAVRTMAEIAARIESSHRVFQKTPKLKYMNPIRYQMIHAAVETAQQLKAKSIIVQTMTGRSAQLLSSYRGFTPIKALCEEEYLMRYFSLVYGVEAYYLPKQTSIDALVGQSVRILMDSGAIKKTDLVVMVGSSPGNSMNTNFLEVREASQFNEGRNDESSV